MAKGTQFGVLLTFIFSMMLWGCGPKYPKCDTDSHCEEKGEVCVDGQCQQCRDDSACAAGQVCQGGRCAAKAECRGAGDCPGNKICRSGKCQIECNGEGDCGAGLACKNNRCVDPLACSGPADCEAGMSCVNGRCSGATNASSDTCNFPTLHFAFNRAKLSKSESDQLKGIADCLKNLGGTVTVEGHADERGTEEYNLALGDRRARSVIDYLVRLGVPRSKVNVVSKGELDPADSGHNESAWAANRRAEFIRR